MRWSKSAPTSRTSGSATGCSRRSPSPADAATSARRATGDAEAVSLLEQSLEDEKRTDELLTRIAESGVNQAAAQNAGVSAASLR
ncbi:MAG: DUF892 family protein [Fimbriimonas sp.]